MTKRPALIPALVAALSLSFSFSAAFACEGSKKAAADKEAAAKPAQSQAIAASGDDGHCAGKKAAKAKDGAASAKAEKPTPAAEGSAHADCSHPDCDMAACLKKKSAQAGEDKAPAKDI